MQLPKNKQITFNIKLFYEDTAYHFNNLTFSCKAQNSSDVKQKISKAEAYLKQNPQDQKNWQQLYILINDNYTKLTAEERTGIRKVLEQYGIWSTGTTYTTNEPGTR